MSDEIYDEDIEDVDEAMSVPKRTFSMRFIDPTAQQYKDYNLTRGVEEPISTPEATRALVRMFREFVLSCGGDRETVEQAISISSVDIQDSHGRNLTDDELDVLAGRIAEDVLSDVPEDLGVDTESGLELKYDDNGLLIGLDMSHVKDRANVRVIPTIDGSFSVRYRKNGVAVLVGQSFFDDIWEAERDRLLEEREEFGE